MLAALTQGRRLAESLMVDTCHVRRQTGEQVDPDTGAVTPTYSDVYRGMCRIQRRSHSVESQQAGEQLLQVVEPELQVPTSVTDVRDGDEVSLTESLDPELVGPVWRVAGPARETHNTMRRFELRGVT